MTHLKRLLVFSIGIIFSCCFVFGADEKTSTAVPTWQVAATAFDVASLPQKKQSSGVLIPLLILEKIRGTSFRYEQQNEKIIAEEEAKREKRIKAINSLQSLYTERDSLYFSVLNIGDVNIKYLDVEKKIKNAEETLETSMKISSVDTDNAKDNEKASKKKITLWTSGEKSAASQLSTINPKNPILPQMKKAKVSALLTGVIESVGAYMRVTCFLYIQPHSSPIAEVSEVGSWEMSDQIIQSLVDQLLPHVYGAVPAQVLVTVDPADASAVVDGDPIKTGVPILLFPGEHSFLFNKNGYYASSKVCCFEPGKKYRMTIFLEEQNLRVISYAKREQTDNVFFEGFDTPIIGNDFALPFSETIGYAENSDGDNAWFIIPEVVFNHSLTEKPLFWAELNEFNISETIEKRRNVMYWSLGALYLFLPISMYYNGTYDNLVQGYNAGVVTDVSEVNRIASISNVTTVIGWGLGINFAVQLVRYMITVNKLTPPVLKPVDPSDLFTTVIPSEKDIQPIIQEEK